MQGFLFVGDPFARGTVKIAVKIQSLDGQAVSLEAADGYINQQPGEGRSAWGVLGRRPVNMGVAAWERWSRSGSVVTGWNGESYCLVESPNQ